MKEIKCDLKLTVSPAVSTKNSLKNIYGFSPNQFVLGTNLNFPNVRDDLLPALEVKTASQFIATNLKGLHKSSQN